jgi:hypothetical protein
VNDEIGEKIRAVIALEVVSKPHLRPNGCVAPQAGFASDFLE